MSPKKGHRFCPDYQRNLRLCVDRAPASTTNSLPMINAALLIDQGVHPKVISTTLNTYGHLFEGLDEAAADRRWALRPRR